MQMHSADMKTARCARMAYVLLLAALCALALLAGRGPAYGSEEPVEQEASELVEQAVSEMPYDGEACSMLTGDFRKEFGMLSPTNGSNLSVTYADGRVRISYVPSNKTGVYDGFYFNAAVADVPAGATHPVEGFDEDCWAGVSDSKDFYDYELDEGYCGYAWPIAPIKAADRGGGTTAEQYYLCVPALEHIDGYLNEVTFTDGMGGELFDPVVRTVTWGSDAVPPEWKRPGYILSWDASYENVTGDLVVNARWMKDDATYYSVTFDANGGKFSDGSATAQVPVEEGGAGTCADMVAAPARDGYTFTGWDPASFDGIDGDLTVTATWADNDDLAIAAVREKIAALPSDPKSLLRDTGNAAAAEAGAAYNALPDALKGRIPEGELLHLARTLIAVLPSDPFKVEGGHAAAINAAQAAFGSLPQALQDVLDGEEASSSRSYGRYLENAAWALDALRAVNNVSTLPSGIYTGQVLSSVNWGKNGSARKLPFTVKSVTVKGGAMTAILEHGSNSSQTLRMGGKEYQNLQTDPSKNSYFEIPINPNSTFHFSVKGKNATDDTDAISYEMTVSADTSTMKPDIKTPDDNNNGGKGNGDGNNGNGNGNNNSGNGSGGNGGSSGGSNSGSGSGSSSGNLSSLMKNSNSTGTGATGTSSNKSVGSNLNTTTSNASSPNGKASSSTAKTGGKTVNEVALSSVADNGAEISPDLMPAIVGGCLLALSLGGLAFSLHFVRREKSSV